MLLRNFAAQEAGTLLEGDTSDRDNGTVPQHGHAGRAAEVAGYPRLHPDSCLTNRYKPGSRLSLHQNRNEQNFEAPIVSLGLSATSLWGGATRADKPTRMRLFHGDVVVRGGPARLTFHGVDTLRSGENPAAEDC